MIWLLMILKVYQEEQLLIQHYVIKHSILAKNPKYDGYQRRLASVVYRSFDKSRKILPHLLLTEEQESILRTNN